MRNEIEHCIVLCRDAATIDVLEGHGANLVVVQDGEEALAAVRSHPGQPVLVDVAAFPEWPKLLRMREDERTVPGIVIGFASPVKHDIIEAAELFCDEVATRPAVLRKLPEVLDQARSRAAGCSSSGNCGCRS